MCCSKRGRQEGQSQRGDVTTNAKAEVMYFEDEGRNYKSRNVNKAGKDKKIDFFWSSQKDCSSNDTLVWVQKPHLDF